MYVFLTSAKKTQRRHTKLSLRLCPAVHHASTSLRNPRKLGSRARFLLSVLRPDLLQDQKALMRLQSQWQIWHQDSPLIPRPLLRPNMLFPSWTGPAIQITKAEFPPTWKVLATSPKVQGVRRCTTKLAPSPLRPLLDPVLVPCLCRVSRVVSFTVPLAAQDFKFVEDLFSFKIISSDVSFFSFFFY